MMHIPMQKWSAPRYRSLKDTEVVQFGDIIEDLQHGDCAVVSKDGYYGMVAGFKAKEVRKLDSVYDIRRKFSR